MKLYSETSVRNGRCFSFGLDCFGTKCDGNFLNNNKSKINIDINICIVYNTKHRQLSM